jgi:phosphopantetheine adenylyltransferase
MNHQLTLEDTEKYLNLLAKQFNEVGRSQILSNEKTWALFLAQKESDVIPREHLTVVESILLGRPIITVETFRELATQVLREYKYCTIIRVLHKMTDGNLLPELVEHSLKMTACVLRTEALPNPGV